MHQFLLSFRKIIILLLLAGFPLIMAGESNVQKSQKKVTKPGLQLYTIRDHLQKDFQSAVDSASKIGYTSYEMAGNFGLSTDSVVSIFRSKNLQIESMHFLLPMFEDSLDLMINDAKKFNAKYLVLAWINPVDFSSLSQYHTLAENLNLWGKKIKDSGLSLAYHNHDFEFQKIADTLPYFILLKETDPELVSFELDIYWVSKSGIRVNDLIKKNDKRFKLVHLKDIGPEPEKKMMDVGSGTINFVELFSLLGNTNDRLFFVEHDQPVNSLESITISLKYLKSLNY